VVVNNSKPFDILSIYSREPALMSWRAKGRVASTEFLPLNSTREHPHHEGK